MLPFLSNALSLTEAETKAELESVSKPGTAEISAILLWHSY